MSDHMLWRPLIWPSQNFARTKRPALFFLEVLRRLSGQMRGRRACDLTDKGKCPTISTVFFPLHIQSAVKRRMSAFSAESWPAICRQARPSRSDCYKRCLTLPPLPLPPSQTPELSRSSNGRQQNLHRKSEA